MAIYYYYYYYLFIYFLTLILDIQRGHRHPCIDKTLIYNVSGGHLSSHKDNAPINVNPVGGGGGSAGKGRGFNAWDYPRCRAFDRVKRPRGRDI